MEMGGKKGRKLSGVWHRSSDHMMTMMTLLTRFSHSNITQRYANAKPLSRKHSDEIANREISVTREEEKLHNLIFY